MRFVVVLLSVLLTAGTAWPCPPSDDPEWRCTKYDFLYEKMYVAPVQIYVRDERGAAPRRTKNMMKHLTGSRWHARNDQAQVDVVRLLDPATLDDAYEAVADARDVVVTRLEKVDHQHRLVIDGAWFRVIRCKEDGRLRTCLQRVA